jgi:hypothetical protein
MSDELNINDEKTARAPVPPPERSAALSVAARTTALSPFDETPEARANSTSLGRWAFDHKKQFSQDNPLAWYGIRNVLNNMVAIVGLMATIVPTRMAMGGIAKAADVRGMRKTQQFFSHSVLQNTLGVGISFSTFRTMYKMWQRNYDRIFIKPEDSQQASQAIHDLPKNLWEDFKQIAPAEYPATMAAAVPLVGIRAAFTPKGPELPQNHWKDVTACALLAYPAFFEVTDRLGESIQLSRGYDTKDKNEHLGKHKMSLKEFLTRQVPGVAAGIVPYIGFNNLWYRKSGRQLSYNSIQIENGVKKIDSFASAFWKERPYEVFWMFSLGRDLYFDAYDKLTGKDKKQAAQGVSKYERRYNPSNAEPAAAPVTLATHQGPTAKVAQVSRDGVAVEPTHERATA